MENKEKDFATEALGAFVGTAVGACMAFWLERIKRVREMEDRHVESVNVAMFNLTQIYAHLFDYRRQVIERNPEGPAQWYEISRARLQPPDLQPFEVRSLAFLLETEHKNVVNRIAIDLTRYQGFLTTIALAQKYNDQVQDASKLKGPAQSIEQLEIWCGPVLKNQVTSTVTQLIHFHAKLMPSVKESALALGSAVKAMYSGRTIIHFEDADTPERLPWYRRPPHRIW